MRAVLSRSVKAVLPLLVVLFTNVQAEFPSSEGVMTTLAGNKGTQGLEDGTGTNATFNRPAGIAYSPDGATLVIVETGNHAVRSMVVATGVTMTLAGTKSAAGTADGTGTSALFTSPDGVAYSPDGSTVVIADAGNQAIRSIVVATGVTTTLAGTKGSTGAGPDGTGTSAKFYYPKGVAFSPDGATVVVGDAANNAVRSIVVATGETTTLAGTKGSTQGSADGTGASATFAYPLGLAYSPDGATVVVGDAANFAVRSIVVSTGVTTTLVGTKGTQGSADGTGASARFYKPYGVAYSFDGSTVVVADYQNNAIRSIVMSTGVTTTLVGNKGTQGSADGTGTNATLYKPRRIDFSPDAASVVVSDEYNHLIRIIAAGQTLSPTPSPTKSPTKAPTLSPTKSPTKAPTLSPTKSPTKAPTLSLSPTKSPTAGDEVSSDDEVSPDGMNDGSNGGDDEDDDDDDGLTGAGIAMIILAAIALTVGSYLIFLKKDFCCNVGPKAEAGGQEMTASKANDVNVAI